MKRDNPGNADYSFKDMTEYSLLFLHTRLCAVAVISPLFSFYFTTASDFLICCKQGFFFSYLHAILIWYWYVLAW